MDFPAQSSDVHVASSAFGSESFADGSPLALTVVPHIRRAS
jgi:hypothetical protein